MSKQITFLFLCFNIWLICGDPVSSNLKLELIQVLFRHGARTPLDCEAKYLPFNKTVYDPWGYGQLTDKGMQQEFKIGQMLREKYNDFLQDVYKPEQVYAYASGVARTKTSLELVLASLYPPSGKFVWNPQLNWFPIPTYSNPRKLDILIKPRSCPKYLKHLQDLYDSEEFKKVAAEHDDVRETMKDIHGKAFKLSDIFCAYNGLVVQRDMNLPNPEWSNDALFDKLRKAIHFYLDTLSYTTTLRRLNGGTLARRFLENINNNSNTKSKQRKVYLYSAHDKTLHAFLKAHNMNVRKQPDYGSAVIVEKYRDENNKVYVKFIYWTGEPKEFSILRLENCAEYCPLEEYSRIIKPTIPSDDEMRCLFDNLQPKYLEKILNTDFAKQS